MSKLTDTAIVLTLLLAATIARAQGLAGEAKFDIAAQDLPTAIIQFSDQAAVQIVTADAKLAGLSTKGVSGTLRVGEALKMLLIGTGLNFKPVGDETVALVSDTAFQSPPAADANGGLRLAHADSGSAAVPESSADVPTDSSGPSSDEPESGGQTEIVVTGTHIRGVKSVGAPGFTITRESIDRAGFATSSDVIQSLPQNFGGGAREDLSGIDSGGSGANIGFGEGANLRGLGNDSTLVLLNGRRLMRGGGGAHFVDISAIPVTAIERVEVLTDGASALYGSDAVGGVVNFVTRSDYQGADTRASFGSVTDGGMRELQFGQVLGATWDRARVLVAYEYRDRGNLASRERAFAADSDLTALGGSNFRSSASNPGNITDFVQNYAIPAGQNGVGLTAGDLLAGVTNLQNQRESTDILPQQQQHSIFLSASQDLRGGAQVFADLHLGRRDFENRFSADSSYLVVPETNPFYVNPFGTPGPIYVNYSFLDDFGPQTATGRVSGYGAGLGVSFDVSSSWRGEVYGSYGYEKDRYRSNGVVDQTALQTALDADDPALAFNPFGDGSNTDSAVLASLRAHDEQNALSRMWMASAKVDGDLFQLPGGTAKLALGSEFRKESYDYKAVRIPTSSPSFVQVENDGARNVIAGFAELYLPLVGAANAFTGVNSFDVSLAGRYEHYDDFGSTSDPRLGVQWSPVEGVTVRGTLGTSFKAPLLSKLTGSTYIYLLADAPDPSSSTGFTNTLALVGLADGLVPEEAQTWTAGVRLNPVGVPNLEIGINYFHIDIENRIKLAVQNFYEALSDNATYASLIIRDPSVEQVNALMNDPNYQGSPIPADQVGAIVDGRERNTAVAEMRGVDLLVSYRLLTGFGAFDAMFSGTQLLQNKEGVTPTSAPVERLNTFSTPVDLKLRSALSWSRAELGATLAVNYIDNYKDQLSTSGTGQPPAAVDAWTTVDVQLAYAAGERSGWLRDLNVALNVHNLFDESPPFINAFGVGYDSLNADPTGRYVSVQVARKW